MDLRQEELNKSITEYELKVRVAEFDLKRLQADSKIIKGRIRVTY